MVQGQSLATLPKQHALQSFLKIHRNICCIVQKKNPTHKYVYIDTNAGCGWNKYIDCPGSPLIAVKTLGTNSYPNLTKLNYKAFFIEIDRMSCLELNQMLWHYPQAQVLNFDNNIALKAMPIEANSLGLIYCDGNGIKDIPIEGLKAFYKYPETYRIDCLINVNAHTLKRVRSSISKVPANAKYPTLLEMTKLIPKQQWWIREPITGERSAKWVFLFGSNYLDMNLNRLSSGHTFYKLQSQQAQQILIELGEIEDPSYKQLELL